MAYGIHTEYIFEEAIETELLTHGGYIKGLSEDFDADLGLFPSYLVTKLKRNMKSTALTPVMDAIMLRKRAIAETIIDQLKNICQVEHSRHRSPKNFFNNLFAALIAYKLTIKNRL